MISESYTRSFKKTFYYEFEILVFVYDSDKHSYYHNHTQNLSKIRIAVNFNKIALLIFVYICTHVMNLKKIMYSEFYTNSIGTRKCFSKRDTVHSN